jgi:pimeloyl-ACP methyl ester carboxylesterase
LRFHLYQWLLGLLIFCSLPATAEVLVLIHGYHANGSTWRSHGVIQGLQTYGWVDSGDYFPSPTGSAHRGPRQQSDKIAITVTLPSEAPIPYQSMVLKHHLNQIKQDFPDQMILMAAHSAGGVVARYYLVHHSDSNIQALFTIASPHLGTAAAEIGSITSDSPLGEAAPMIGLNTVNRSRGLYEDLKRERPGNLLFWLNRQPHPEMTWVSLVRKEEIFGLERLVVPAYSQDMRNIPALGSRALSYRVPGDHELNHTDGILLADMIRYLIPTQQD